jgi:hypothetical protein
MIYIFLTTLLEFHNLKKNYGLKYNRIHYAIPNLLSEISRFDLHRFLFIVLFSRLDLVAVL